jgi:hypothetical protein
MTTNVTAVDDDDWPGYCRRSRVSKMDGCGPSGVTTASRGRTLDAGAEASALESVAARSM